MYTAVELITAKRNGHPLSADQSPGWSVIPPVRSWMNNCGPGHGNYYQGSRTLNY